MKSKHKLGVSVAFVIGVVIIVFFVLSYQTDNKVIKNNYNESQYTELSLPLSNGEEIKVRMQKDLWPQNNPISVVVPSLIPEQAPVYISPEPTTTSIPTAEYQPISHSFQLEGYNQQTNSYYYIEFGNYAETPILWRVLEVNKTDALLFSEEIIEIMRFDDDSVKWENSNVKNWLNGTFFNNAFNNEERSIVRRKYGMEPVFLLSVQDLTKAKYGFNMDAESIDPNRAASVSGYVSRKYGNTLHVRNGKSIYYTSDASSSTSIAAVVSTGQIGTASIINREYDDVGIRPAIWIGIDNLDLAGGNGTYDDPYR